MSYIIYKTKGIIFSKINYGESNQIVEFFSKDFGLIKAHAQNSRSISSKMRYGLNTFSYSNFDLIKGKNFWKITGVEIKKEYSTFQTKTYNKILINISSLIKQFFIQEEKNDEIFELIKNTLKSFNLKLIEKYPKEYEIFLVLNILYNLG